MAMDLRTTPPTDSSSRSTTPVVVVAAVESEANTTTTSTTCNSITKSKPMGFLAYANCTAGGLKRHQLAPVLLISPKQENDHKDPLPRPPLYSSVSDNKYKECMRNHAASIGGHALDGCCEYMPSPTPTPNSFRCAACGCHRNFHRREGPVNYNQKTPWSSPSSPSLSLSPSPSPSPPPPQVLLTTSTSFNNNNNNNKDMIGKKKRSSSISTDIEGFNNNKMKRFRSKFSSDQKEKMYHFSNKAGWKIQNLDKKLVDDFCKQVGVPRDVLKVWMHNNKNTLRLGFPRSSSSSAQYTKPFTTTTTITTSTSTNNNNNNNIKIETTDHHDHHHHPAENIIIGAAADTHTHTTNASSAAADTHTHTTNASSATATDHHFQVAVSANASSYSSG